MINSGLTQRILFSISLLMGLSFCMSSCYLIPEEVHTDNGTYKRYDFDPYSKTREPNRGQLFGFYIDNYKYIEVSTHKQIGWATYVSFGEAMVEDDCYLLVSAQITGPVEPIGIYSVWLSLPYGDIVTGQEYTCSLRGNALNIYTKNDEYLGDSFVGDAYNWGYYWRYVPVTSVSVVYDKNTDYEIQGHFTAEVELNLESGIRTITLENGVFRFFRNDTGFYRSYTYEDWLKDEGIGGGKRVY